MNALVAAPLAVLILAAWLGAAGFARLQAPLDRLHAVAFVNAFGLLAVLLAALLQEGLTDRVGKIALLLVATLLAGAASTHAIARALRVRGSAPDAD